MDRLSRCVSVRLMSHLRVLRRGWCRLGGVWEACLTHSDGELAFDAHPVVVLYVELVAHLGAEGLCLQVVAEGNRPWSQRAGALVTSPATSVWEVTSGSSTLS